MNSDRTARQRTAKSRLLDLPHSVANRDDVVLGYRAFCLHREHPVQIRPAGAPKGAGFLFCRHREFAVEDVDVVLAQESVGLFQRADSR